MPSEVLDLKGLSSSSFFSDDLHHSDEGQVGVWKSASMPNHRASNMSGASSSVEKFSIGDCLTENSLENHESFPVRDQNASLILNRHAVGAERTSNYFARSNEVNIMNSQYESSLFSSSLSDIFTRKLRFSPSNALYGHSVDTVASHFEEEEVFESLEELEAQTIGNLLPDDDDLLAGVLTDGLDCLVETNGEDDAEDLDFFSNVGGMDLGDDGLSVGQKNSESSGGLFNNLPGMHNGAMAGEHPLGEHPSRTLFVRNINSNVEDSELKVLFEQYGDIRTLYTACKHRGFVMISYYDIRAARNAMKALQNKPLRRRKLDIHYSIPKDNPSEKDINQGTLVVFNLESSVSNEELRQIFGVYGEIKEIREAPHRSHHKFIEFYDIRAAEAALCALNLSDIAGKQIKLEPSRPGGVRRSSLVQQFHPQLEREDIGLYLQQGSPPVNCSAGFSGLVPSGTIKSSSMSNGSVLGVHSMIRAPSLETVLHHGISSSVPSSLPSVMRSESIGNQSGFIDSSHSPSQLKLGIRAAPSIHPHSLPEHPDGLNNNVHCNSLNTIAGNISLRPPERADSRQLVNFNGRSIELNEDVFASGGNRTCPIPGPHYTWGNSYRPQPPAPGVVWPNSPSYMNGISAAHTPTQVHGVPRAASHLMHTVLPMNNHHVGSAPAVNPSIWDRQHAYAGELSKASGFHSGSIGNMNLPNNSPQSMEFFSHIFPQVGGNSVELPIPQRNVGLQSHHQRCMVFPGRGQILPMMNSFDSTNERGRSRRNEAASNQADKKQYELDIDRIMRGEDNRTTLMIKNIPNKYTSKMLLAAIDERHRGTYDFIYLPIDFKNKCNVGYAFINMTDPSLIIPFYEAFNGKKWEKFNSEKVASLAYARIQGKAALIAHFQNSSLMNEDKRCRPILFNTDGPNAGDQVPFPMGVNVRTRPGKARTNTQEENHDEGLVISGNGENCSSGDASSSSFLVKDLDQPVP